MMHRILFIWLFVFCIKWLGAQPLSLYQAIQIALEHNETALYSARQNYLSSQSQLKAFCSGYRPVLDLSISSYHNQSRFLTLDHFYYSRTQIIIPNINLGYLIATPMGSKTRLNFEYQTVITGPNAYQTSPQLQISYQQPLSRKGIQSGHADIIRAQNNYYQSEMSYQQQKENLILSIINAYFQVWQLAKNVEQAELDMQSARRVLSIAELRLTAGQISEFEVMNTRVQYRLAEDNFKITQNSLKSQQIYFLRLLGEQDLDKPIKLVEDIAIASIDIERTYALHEAIKNRLEIKQNELSLELMDIALKADLASIYPTLFINARYSWSSQYYTPFDIAFSDLPNRNWSVQCNVNFPILDGGLRFNQIQITRYAYAIQQKNLELLKQDIGLEIEEQLRTLKLNQERVQSLTLNLNLAEEALGIAELRFKQGKISTTEIENIRQRYNNAQNSLNNARISYIIQSASLAKAMGNLDSWVSDLDK